MRHNQYDIDFSFVKEPMHFNKYTEKDLLCLLPGGNLVHAGHQTVFRECINEEDPRPYLHGHVL